MAFTGNLLVSQVSHSSLMEMIFKNKIHILHLPLLNFILVIVPLETFHKLVILTILTFLLSTNVILFPLCHYSSHLWNCLAPQTIEACKKTRRDPCPG